MNIKQMCILRYTGFLVVTFFLTLAIYIPSRNISWAVALFVVVNMGNAHYIMAYFANIRTWQQLSEKIRRNRLCLWIMLATIYLFIFYLSGLPFAWAIFSILLITSFHFFRDYAFFYYQISSVSAKDQRPLYLTIALTGAYLSLLFLQLYTFPQLIGTLLLNPISPLVFGMLGYLGILVALIGGYLYISHVYGMTPLRFFSFLTMATMGFIIGQASLELFNPIDYVYVLVLWHFVMWLALSVYKTWHRQSLYHTDSFFERIRLWQSNTKTFLIVAFISHIIVFLPPLLLLEQGIWHSFSEISYANPIWGLYGYPFWSFLHIVFTSFRRVTSMAN